MRDEQRSISVKKLGNDGYKFGASASVKQTDTWLCKNCGEKNKSTDNFCKNCGEYK